MIEMLTIGGSGDGQQIVVEQGPVLWAPLENSMNVYTKKGYEEYVGFTKSKATLRSMDSRGGIDLSQPIDVEFSDRVFSSPAWTMCWWMFAENLINWHNIGSGMGPGNNNTMLIQFGDTPYYNNSYFMINYPSGSADAQWYRTRLAPDLNAWTHLAITWDSGVLKTYKNGVLVNTQNTNIFSGFGNYNWRLAEGPTRQGLLSNLMFYDEALDEAGVLDAMNMFTLQ